MTESEVGCLAVSIVAWNCRDELVECLAALEREIPETPVHVLDNASSDGTAAAVRDRGPPVQLVESPVNLGFGPGHNRVLREIRAEYGLVLNPDTLINRQAILRCLSFLKQNPDAGVVGCSVRDRAGALLPGNYRSLPKVRTRFADEFFIRRLAGRERRAPTFAEGTARDVGVVPGAFMMIRMSAASKIGFFDENLFLYSEDTDLCLRMRQAGYRVIYLSDVGIMHLGARSTEKSYSTTAYEFYRSEDYYFVKHFPARSVVAYRGVVLVSVTLRLTAWGAARLVRPGATAPRLRCGVYLRVLRGYGRALRAGRFFRREEILDSARPQ